MATWSKDEKGIVGIEFGADDLVFSNILNTKRELSEMMENSFFKIEMSSVQHFDSAGLQLLIYFISALKLNGAQVEIETLPPEVIDICSIYGIEDMANVEKMGGSNV